LNVDCPKLAPLPWHKPDRVHRGRQRFYRTPLGELPSVTTILSWTKSKEARAGLNRWRDRVGYQASEEIKHEAAARGTHLHAIAEEQLKAWVPDEAPPPGRDPYWDSLAPVAEEVAAGCVRLVEGAIWHPLGYAGTMDWMAWWRGAWTAGDWKSSKKEKKEEWVGDYKLQAAAYTAGVAYTYRDVIPRSEMPVNALIAIAVRGKDAQLFGMGPEELVSSWNEFKERVRLHQEMKR